jgi:NADP-dependent 3-hydroxy acid dehydrogenase YdfG
MGHDLYLVARREKMLIDLKEELDQKPRIIVADLSREENCNSLYDELKDENIDILINNAGMAVGTEKVFESEMEDYDVVIVTNVKGVLYMIKAVVPQMVERKAKGVVVNMGSVAGNIAYGGGAVYCGSKAAIRYITDGLRIDLMDTPIRVTCIEPGLVETEFSIIRFRGDKDKAKAVYTGIDALTADDIGAAVAYVCNLPENVQIPEMILTPANQADSINKYYQK